MPLELWLAQDTEADKLLGEDFFALLVGMLLYQRYPMEAAFRGPKKIADRMGGFDVYRIAAADPGEFVALAAAPPAIHHYPRMMAKRIQDLARYVVEHYDGLVERLWTEGNPDGEQVLARLKALPGFGDQKAPSFLALLGKQFGVRPSGWRVAAGSYAEEGSRSSVADVVDAQSRAEVRGFKRRLRNGPENDPRPIGGGGGPPSR